MDGGRELITTLNARLPAWRAHRPYRTRAVRWPVRTVVAQGHEFDFPSLPWVGFTWTQRGFAYWRRRVTAVVLLAIAVAVMTTLDVGFVSAAASSSTSALVWTVVVLVALAAASLVFYWRVDLFSRYPAPGTRALPTPLRFAGSFVGVAGLCVTPLWTLSFLVDMLPRFTVFERAAWQRLADEQPDGWGETRPDARERS